MDLSRLNYRVLHSLAAFLIFLSLTGVCASASEHDTPRSSDAEPTASKAEPESDDVGDPNDPSLVGPATREEWWRKKKLEKLENSRPTRPSLFEKTLRTIENKINFTRSSGNVSGGGFYPKIETLTSGSGLSVGGGYRYDRMGGWPLDFEAEAGYSYRGYEAYELRLGQLIDRKKRVALSLPDDKILSQFTRESLKEPGLSFYADIRYRHFPQQDFYGVGPQSSQSDRSDFLLRGTSYDGVSEIQFTRRLGMAVRGGYLDFKIGPGSDENLPNTKAVFASEVVPGLVRQPDFFHLGTAFLFDFRDNPGNPHAGGMLGLTATRFDDRGGSQFEFTRLALDARQYLPLGSRQRVLAFRFFTSSDDADRGSSVPFYLLQPLGGSRSLRGFDSFRFRDRNLLYLSAEYRWETVEPLEMAVFYDAGKVFPSFSDFSFEGLAKSYGIGFRLKSEEAVIFRMDFGWSREGGQIQFSLRPSF